MIPRRPTGAPPVGLRLFRDRPGWSAELTADAELVVTDPGGRLFTSHPPGQHPRPPPALLAA
ncbi:MAG: hypothetical protein H0V52_10090 [Acidimicrobiia bacterium]|nr:hypothetical protein [Acidimicrobiia bacterium]